VGLSSTATLVMFTALIAAAAGSSRAHSSREKERRKRLGWGLVNCPKRAAFRTGLLRSDARGGEIRGGKRDWVGGRRASGPKALERSRGHDGEWDLGETRPLLLLKLNKHKAASTAPRLPVIYLEGRYSKKFQT
jgi:hypothetical protein